MDWSKIKTILIVLLLLTNLLLATNLLITRTRFHAEQEDAADAVQQLYRAKGVEIEATMPEVPARLPGFEIAQITFQRSYVELVLGTTLTELRSRYSNDRMSALIENTRLAIAETPYIEEVILSRNIKFADPVALSDEEWTALKKAIDDFFLKYYIMVPYQDAELYEIDDMRLVRLYQQFEGYTNDESQVYVWLKGDVPVGLYVENIVSRIEDDNQKYAIIPVNDALYAALPKLSGQDRLIEIEIVYKLNDESLPVRDIVQGEALPYYKLSFANGAPIYVPAIRTGG